MIRRRRRPRLIDRLAGPLDDGLALLFDDAAGVLIVDRSNRIVRTNARLAAMAKGADLSSGNDSAAIFAPEDRDHVGSLLRACLRGDRIAAPFHTRLAAADPESGTAVALSVTPLREADGALSGLMVRLTDIGAEKRLEARLAHGQKLQAVGQLAGGIAHDFNNLLTAIIGATDSVLDRSGIDAETRDDVRQARLAAERGAALVRQLLAFGRRQPMRPRIIEVNAAIRDLALLLRRLLGEKVRLEVTLEEPGRRVRADPTQLDQVLINLAVNARDAMPEGGLLTVRSAHRTLYRPETVGAETIAPGRYVLIEVADTGIGIPQTILPHIFEPFFTTRRDAGGNGLGLSTVHGILRQSDGFVTVDSTPGHGTTVCLYLPRHDAEEADQPPDLTVPRRTTGAPPLPRESRPRTVLLVEDEDPVRRLADRALRRAGWRVLAADSAEAALQCLPSPGAPGPAPDLVLSDAVMPGMDGPALIAALREVWPGLPAILVSGYAESAVRGKLADQDILFLPKPYSLKALLELADRAVAVHVPG